DRRGWKSPRARCRPTTCTWWDAMARLRCSRTMNSGRQSRPASQAPAPLRGHSLPGQELRAIPPGGKNAGVTVETVRAAEEVDCSQQGGATVDAGVLDAQLPPIHIIEG